MTPTRSGPAGGTGPQSQGTGRAADAVQDTPPQPTLEDLLRDGRARRDAGAEAAALSAHTAWRVAAEVELERLAATGLAFTVDDLRDRVGQLGGHPNACGGLFIGAARRGLIVPVGFRQSARPEAHARVVRVWRGAP